MCRMYEKCTYGECVTYVAHIARSTQETSIAHIPHIICVTVESGVIRDPFAERVFVQSGFGAPGLALVQSCVSAGVAPGDGRHQPIPKSQDAPDLDAGSASRCASVHWTPSAPAGAGRRAPNGPRKGPNSIGHQGPPGSLMTPQAAPYFARGYPGTPRGMGVPPGTPAPPPVRPPVPRPRAAPLDPSVVRHTIRVPGYAARNDCLPPTKGFALLKPKQETSS